MAALRSRLEVWTTGTREILLFFLALRNPFQGTPGGGLGPTQVFTGSRLDVHHALTLVLGSAASCRLGYRWQQGVLKPDCRSYLSIESARKP
jgi:hypothetical protein